MTTATLSDVCDILIGRTPSRNEPRFWGGDLPWLSIADMNQGRNIALTKERVTLSACEECNLRVVEPGTVVMSFKLSIGKVGVTQTRMATNEAIAALPVRNRDRLDPSYLSRVLESMDHSGGANRAAMGGTLNKASLSAIRIPVPPIDEQRRIAAILDKADEGRTQRRQALAHLDTLTQSIFHSMFGGIPATSVLSDAIGNLVGGKNLVGADDSSNPYRVLKISAVTTGSYLEAESKPLPDDYEPLGDHIVRPGDVIISRANTTELVGASALAESTNGNSVLPDKLWRTVPRSNADSRFLLATLQSASVRAEISRRSTGSGGSMKNISKPKLLSIPIALPPLELQQTFATRVAAVERLKESHRKHLAELDALFASLQHRAFKGEL